MGVSDVHAMACNPPRPGHDRICNAVNLQIPVERIEALLLWQDPYVSAKVFGPGLYILICLRHLVCGEASIMLLSVHHYAASLS